MKNCCSWLPEAVAIAGVAIGVGVALQGWPSWPTAEGQTWAAWVQAVGSVLAILAAIWVAYDQHEKSDRRQARAERDEVRNFLSGVREELEVNWNVYMEQVGQHVIASPPERAIELTWPVPDNPFKVYAATAGSIGRLPDPAIRKSIIVTYVVAGGLLHTWRMHNELRDRRDSEEKIVRKDMGQRRANDWMALEGMLREYSRQLAKHQDKAGSKIKETIAQIDAYLASTV